MSCLPFLAFSISSSVHLDDSDDSPINRNTVNSTLIKYLWIYLQRNDLSSTEGKGING
jgi:hypothetical protein